MAHMNKFRIEKPECTDALAGSWLLTFPDGFGDAIDSLICRSFDEAVAEYIKAELRWCPMCGKGAVVHPYWGWICEACGANDVAAGQTKPPPHPVPRAERGGTICEDYELGACTLNTCPAGCYLAIKDAPCCEGGIHAGHARNCRTRPAPVTPIYIGSQTLIERDGKYFVEHRNADGELTHTDDIGDLLGLNFHLLGIEGPRR